MLLDKLPLPERPTNLDYSRASVKGPLSPKQPTNQLKTHLENHKYPHESRIGNSQEAEDFSRIKTGKKVHHYKTSKSS